MRTIIFIIISVLFATSAFAAAPVLTGVSGTSVSPILTGTPTIYGGLAGPLCAAVSPTATCNSCDEMIASSTCGTTDTATAPFCSCNEKRIHNGLRVTFSVESSSNDIKLIKTTAEKEEITGTASSGAFTTTWNDLCLALGDSVTDCESISLKDEGTVYLWVDADSDDEVDTDETVAVKVNVINGSLGNMDSATSEGAAGYSIYPGDEKVYVDDVSISTLSTGATVQAVRMWFSPLGFDKALYGDPSVLYQDIPVDKDGNTSEPKVTGLTNGVTYHFRSTLLDKAGNISAWATDTYIADATINGTCAAAGEEPTPDPRKSVGCIAAGKPGQVLGMLTEDMNCFIATAAYGTSLEPKLNAFRKFRMVFLLQNTWGRRFVNWYYNVGPRAARWISDKPIVRGIVRTLLWPVYGFVQASLHFGMATALALFVLLPTIIVSLAALVINRKVARANT